MRILVTGSRNWTNNKIVELAIYGHIAEPARTTVVHGGAKGADMMADVAARAIGATVEIHKPDYKTYPGWQAPLMRNDAMLDSGIRLVIAFLLGTPEKGGTLYTINGAKQRRIPVVIYNWPGDPEYKG